MRVAWITGLFLILAAVVEKASAQDSDDLHYYTINFEVAGTYTTNFESEDSKAFQTMELKYNSWCKNASLAMAKAEGVELEAEDVKCDLKEISTIPGKTDKIKLEIEIHFANSIDPKTLPAPDVVQENLQESAVQNQGLEIDGETIGVPEHPTGVVSKAYLASLTFTPDADLTYPQNISKIKERLIQWCKDQCVVKFPAYQSCSVSSLEDIPGDKLSASLVVQFAQEYEQAAVREALNTGDVTVTAIQTTVVQATSVTTASANARTQRATAAQSSSATSDSTGVISHKISLPTAFCLFALSWLMTSQHCR